jgi:hypothetical protein
MILFIKAFLLKNIKIYLLKLKLYFHILQNLIMFDHHHERYRSSFLDGKYVISHNFHFCTFHIWRMAETPVAHTNKNVSSFMLPIS